MGLEETLVKIVRSETSSPWKEFVKKAGLVCLSFNSFMKPVKFLKLMSEFKWLLNILFRPQFSCKL